MTGLELPRPGRATFQTRLFGSSSWTGRFWFSATPRPPGPRKRSQFSAEARVVVQVRARQAARERKFIAGRAPAREDGRDHLIIAQWRADARVRRRPAW